MTPLAVPLLGDASCGTLYFLKRQAQTRRKVSLKADSILSSTTPGIATTAANVRSEALHKVFPSAKPPPPHGVSAFLGLYPGRACAGSLRDVQGGIQGAWNGGSFLWRGSHDDRCRFRPVRGAPQKSLASAKTVASARCVWAFVGLYVGVCAGSLLGNRARSLLFLSCCAPSGRSRPGGEVAIKKWGPGMEDLLSGAPHSRGLAPCPSR